MDATSPPPMLSSPDRNISAGGLPRMQEAGLILVILLLGALLTFRAETRTVGTDRINGFLNASNLLGGVATPMSFYAIMAVGATFVIISGGIDISVGSIFALSALGTAAVLQRYPAETPAWKVL